MHMVRAFEVNGSLYKSHGPPNRDVRTPPERHYMQKRPLSWLPPKESLSVSLRTKRIDIYKAAMLHV
jgi:hypothetical protein